MQRRSFLKAAAASAFAIPAILGAHAGGAARREELTMEIKRIGSQPSAKGPAEWFTGSVRVDPLFEAPAPARVRGASVTFEPGARTAWHPHPLGQTFVVTAGVGCAQREGGSIVFVERLRRGQS